MNNSYETDKMSPTNISNFDPNMNYSPAFVITGATAVSFSRAARKPFTIKPKTGDTRGSQDSNNLVTTSSNVGKADQTTRAGTVKEYFMYDQMHED